MSEFKPERTRSVVEFAKEVGASALQMFRSKDGESMYVADKGAPQVCFAFVSKNIKSAADLHNPVVSTFLDDELREYHVLHNEGGKQAEASLM